MRKLIRKIYIALFAKRRFFGLNNFLFELSLNGLGILNYENDLISGEKAFIDYLIKSKKLDSGVILDVGANVGHYSVMLRNENIKSTIYAFEPHPVTYKSLKEASLSHRFNAVPKGLGERDEFVKIYDYSSNEGSEHASIYKDVIEQIHKGSAKGTDIELTTVDNFVSANNITEIALLKIDTEGNELNVLKGARLAIDRNLIHVIQIEFNEMNVVSRTFMKDIVDLLSNYTFYRLFPDGLQPLGTYRALTFELFAFQNIVAIRK
ncbi:FkbM family methyltransferase [Dyadobacter sp. CY326]|uniref:FkbM family methyltransferase n=1 Tax=Dyadobacter sp. CY326 TaxID=2907300 RepID=UPI001F014381|nr:FkbM family methyltransferase [Dyadobacter sp. CY326]MCE7065383.1 FkbM family methyltransferase [Dyadobacter sp. CY326]